MAHSDSREYITMTIAAAGSVSAAVPVGGNTVVGIILPATGSGDFDATTAYLGFHVSVDDTTYHELMDNAGSGRLLTIAEDNTLGATDLDPAWFAAFPFVKVATYSDNAWTAQTQTAETTFTLVTASDT